MPLLCRYIKSFEKMNRQLAVVLGMHRSGTSLTTRSLATLGFTFGNNLMGPISGQNDKGFWEDNDIVNLNEEMLKECGKEWWNSEKISDQDIENLKRKGYKATAISLANDKIKENQRLGLKDPRITKLFGFWSSVFKEVDAEVFYVLALRNPKSVANSLCIRDGIESFHSYMLWTDHYLNALKHLGENPWVKIEYEKLVDDPVGELKKISTLTNLELITGSLQEFTKKFTDKKLEHARYEINDCMNCKDIPEICKILYGHLTSIDKNHLSLDLNERKKLLHTQAKKLLELQPICIYIDTTTKSLQQAKAQAEQAKAEAEQARAEAEQARAEAENIKNSKFWRITRPARSLIDLLKNNYN